MNIENLIISMAFKDLKNDKLTVVNVPCADETIHLELVPMLVVKELDALVYKHRLEYPESATVSLTFRCIDFLDQKAFEPDNSGNLSH